MENKIDPQLAFLSETAADSAKSMVELFESDFFGIESAVKSQEGAKAKSPEVQVLVQGSVEAEALHSAGLKVRSEIADVFTGTITLDKIAKLAAVPGVERIESAREMISEQDLAIVDTRVNLVHVGPPGRRGSGVIVATVDSGIDYTHPAFRRTDGTSRILFIWDQNLTPTGGEASPAGFGYGVLYTNAQINVALAAANPFATVRHQVGLGDHGTHVAGIAAGNGRGSSATQPALRFMGVAPEADIIVVAVGGSGPEGMATSANALDAVNFCYQQADVLTRPCAVNMSLGDNLGPHDGTSLLERGLDNLLGGPGRGFVKSAGNVGAARHHAGGTVPASGTISVGFAQPAGNDTPDQLDFWYSGTSNFRVEVIDSAGAATAMVNVGTATTFNLAGGNTVRIDHRDNDPFNGDKRIFITITRGTAAQIRPGNWAVRLRRASAGGTGRFDGWIQRHNTFNQRPTFNAPFESNDRTISTPGTAREVITAANYITRGAGIGGLASSSSRGPTRDGRAAPTIAAPGTEVFSANARFTSTNPDQDPYIAMTGTSMSAPHITGVLALMLQKNPRRTQEQLRQCLVSTARSDAFTGPVPNTGFGAGKVDAQAAVNCVPAVLTPRSVVIATCPPLTTIAPNCPTRVAVLCQPTVIVANCPTQVIVQCQPSLVTLCQPTVVAANCPTNVGFCQQSVVVATCPPLTSPVTCLQVTVVTCPQQTVLACPQQTVLGCPQPTLPGGCGGPSVVDGCPSTPGGCNPGTVVINPGRPVLDPGNIPRLNPRLRGLPGDGTGMDWSGGQPPEQGYFEYDESWFDPDESGQS